MNNINIRGKAEIEAIHKSCRCVVGVLELMKDAVNPGISTSELDRIAYDYIINEGGRPAFKGYKASFASSAFPSTICASINNELVHGIPSKDRVLMDGDIISIDVGVEMNGFYGDAAFTYKVGNVSEDIERLLRATNSALIQSIDYARNGNHLYDISYIIEKTSDEYSYKVVKNYTGHGIGTQLHEPPQVPNYGIKGTGPKLKKGMVLAIEPMFIDGEDELVVFDDGWTVGTKNRSLCAHFEHTIAITKNGPEILTESKLLTIED
jgi:methionyl aminopeptidase